MLLTVRMVLTKLPFGPRFPGNPIGPAAPYMIHKVSHMQIVLKVEYK